MYTSKYVNAILITIFSIGFLVTAVWSKNTGVKVWTQTTESDFAKGLTDSVVITRMDDGEIQLPHPLVRTREDTVDNSTLRFQIFDTDDSYLIIQVDDKNLYVKKYAPGGEVLIDRIHVNKDYSEKRINFYAGCFNDQDHGFMIVWSGQVQSENFICMQLFDPVGTPVGDNQLVNDEAMVQGCNPSVLFDAMENYRIFWSQGNWDGSAIYYQKYSVAGEKIGTNQELNPGNDLKHAYNPLAAKNSRGEFVVAWTTIVDQEPVSTYTDVYLRFFNEQGEPNGPYSRVDDDPGVSAQGLGDICYDHEDNLLLVWFDRRNITDGNFNEVYAQLYNADGVKLNRNLRVGALNPFHDGGLGSLDILSLPDNQFRISWEGDHMGAPPGSEIVMNQWKIVKVPAGDFTSPVFDAGPGGADWHTLSWSEKIANDTTAIAFQIRSADTPEALEPAGWYGPVGVTDFYLQSDGQEINPVHTGDRYVQFKAYLSAEIPGMSPILEDVSFRFATRDTIAPQTPTGLAAQKDIHQIRLSWEPNNEPDLKMYRLYRGKISRDYNIYRTKEIISSQASYIDKDVKVGTTYFYAIAAVDSNLNESPLSGEVSALATGGRIYVNDNAGTGGDGTINRPFPTITDGLASAVFGDTVNVLPGNYNEMITIGNGVSLIGPGANLAKIEGLPDGSWVINCGDSSMVKGFTIINKSEGNAIFCEKASPLVTENVLINYGGSYASGIQQGENCSSRIIKNIISLFGTGVSGSNGYWTMIPGCVRNNIFIDCGYAAIYFDVPNSEIINNTIVQNAGTGIITGTFDNGMQVMNNIIYLENTGDGTGIWDHGESTFLYNNIFAYRPYRNCTPGEGSISEIPVFRQERPNDFRLMPGSPGVDAGNPASEFNDRDGSRNDMGAFGGPDPIDENMIIESSTSIAVSNASGFPGDSIIVPVSLGNLGGACRLQFDVTYDDNVLDAFDVAKTELTTGFNLNWTESPGRVTLNLESTSEIIAGTGEVAKIYFSVDAACRAGEACPLGLANILIENCSGKPFRILQVSNGAFIVHLGSAGGQYVFVDQANTGFENGSRNQPFRTISQGISNAAPGDTVLVAAGEYNEQLVMREDVYVKGMGALVTRLFTEKSDRTVLFDGVNQSGISGMTVEADAAAMATIACQNSSPVIRNNKIVSRMGMVVGISCDNASNPVIADNLFRSFDDGNWIWCSGSNPVVQHNTFVPGDFCDHGIQCFNDSRPVIIQNTFHGSQHGERFINVREASPQIIGNTFHGKAYDGITMMVYTSTGVQIFNNIIFLDGKMTTGIWLRTCENAEIVNNTIYSNGGRAVYIDESTWVNMNNIYTGSDFKPFNTAYPPAISYNAFWDFSGMIDDAIAGPDVVVADPQFVSMTDRNFRLAPNSPCIDSGNPGEEYDDLDGSRNDMGAYGGPFGDSAAYDSRGVVLTMPSVTAAPGNFIIIPLESNFAAGVAGIDLILNYDPSVLSIEDVRTADLTRSFSLAADFSGKDSVTLSLVSPMGIQSEHGSLVQLLIRVSADADTGKSTLVSIKQATLRSEVSAAIQVGGMNNGEISISGDMTGIPSDRSALIPREFMLFHNYPNPFNAGTCIRYGLPDKAANHHVSIDIYNVLGQLTRRLVRTTQAPGYYTITWDGRDDAGLIVPTGIYMYVLRAGDVKIARKLLILK